MERAATCNLKYLFCNRIGFRGYPQSAQEERRHKAPHPAQPLALRPSPKFGGTAYREGKDKDREAWGEDYHVLSLKGFY
jgi:hypothetical protein